MQRPTGVTILAVLAFLGAAFLVLACLGFFFGHAWLAAVAAHRAGSLCATCLRSFGVVGGILSVGLAALSIAVGVGLLGLKSWARILAIILVALGLAVNVILLLGAVVRHAGFGLMHHHHVHMLVAHLVGMAIDVWILYYLFRPHVKQAFGVV
jgi:hypothetical protein